MEAKVLSPFSDSLRDRRCANLANVIRKEAEGERRYAIWSIFEIFCVFRENKVSTFPYADDFANLSANKASSFPLSDPTPTPAHPFLRLTIFWPRLARSFTASPTQNPTLQPLHAANLPKLLRQLEQREILHLRFNHDVDAGKVNFFTAF